MKALAISICAHLAVLWMCSLQAFNEYGIVNGENSKMPISRPMVVKLISGESTTQPPQAQARTPETTIPAPVLEPPGDPVISNTADDSKSDDKLNFMPSGRLTRAPSPLEEIDLNVTSIDEVAVVGSIDLTILIDETGNVVDVVIPDYPSGTTMFANRVAARFRMARFAPGEIDGIPVKSRLQITVVSETQREFVGD